MTKLTEERIKDHMQLVGSYSHYMKIAERHGDKFGDMSGATSYWHKIRDDFRAIEAELQPVQEPVAWRITKRLATDPYNKFPFVMQVEPLEVQPGTLVEPLYLAPPDQTAEIERLREEIKHLSKPLAVDPRDNKRIATLEAALREAAGHFETLTIGNPAVSLLATKALATINKALGEE